MAETTTEDVRRSPFAPYTGILASMPDGMRAREIPFLTMVSIRAREPLGALPERPNTFVVKDGATICWLGPTEWLEIVDADPGATVDRLSQELGTRGAVVDVSGQRTVLELTGERVRDLLSHGCAMDLSPQAAPTGTSLTTVLALAGVTILVLDDGATGGVPTFWLLVRSSFARYMAQWLQDASTEYRGE